MGELHGILFNCSRFLCDTKSLIDGKVTDKNCMTYSALLFPLTKVLNSAEIIHLAHNGMPIFSILKAESLLTSQFSVLEDPDFAVFADLQTPSGTASMLGSSGTEESSLSVRGVVMNSTVVDGGSNTTSQAPNISIIVPPVTSGTPTPSSTTSSSSSLPSSSLTKTTLAGASSASASSTSATSASTTSDGAMAAPDVNFLMPDLPAQFPCTDCGRVLNR